MCSKRTGRGFLLSPSPLPLKTLVRSAPGRFDTQRRGVGRGAERPGGGQLTAEGSQQRPLGRGSWRLHPESCRPAPGPPIPP